MRAHDIIVMIPNRAQANLARRKALVLRRIAGFLYSLLIYETASSSLSIHEVSLARILLRLIEHPQRKGRVAG
jgi:uncharacterized membrane protein